MTVIVCAAPAVCGEEPVTTNFAETSGLTVTESRSVPVVVIEVEPLPPSVALATTFAVSTLYSFIERPVVFATPAVKVSAVRDPKLIAVAELFVTVGVVAGLVEALAPEKVMLWLPV